MMSARRARLAGAAIVAFAIGGCTNEPAAHSHHPVPATPPTHSVAAKTGCNPPSPITESEIRGTGHKASLYGLLMPQRPLPVQAGEQVKIVWRMTGSGPIELSAINPHGKRIPLQWGPEPHGHSSNYHRPGEEWGAGYEFTGPGCWHLQAERTVGSADVWLHVDSR